MKKLKILHILPSFGVGGAEKLVLDYLSYFDENEVEIKAISMYGKNDTINDKFIKENKLNVLYFDKKPGLDLSMLIKIDNEIKKYKPDIIHSHMNTMKYIYLSILKNKKIKLVHTIHNEPEKDASRLDKIFNKIAFKYLKCTPVALSTELATKINTFYKVTNSKVINNGVDLEKFKNIVESKEEIRKRLSLPEKSFVIGHVGRFTKQKNHDFIVEVYKRFNEIEKNTTLLLIGEGELKKDIENKIEKLGLTNKVKFLGLRKDIPDLIKAMDVFLFPSLHEGFPITLIEAQATGVRCIISNNIDPNAILSENTISLGLDDSIDKWCKIIYDSDIVNNSYNSLDNYDIKIIIKTLIDLYKKK